MRKIIFSLVFMLITASTFAQEKGKVRFGIDGGLGLPNAGAGLSGDFDFRYNVMDNVNVGLKLSMALLAKDFKSQDENNNSATASAIGSTLLTGDYYFSKGESLFTPFVGCGIGRYRIMNIQVAEINGQSQSTSTSITYLSERKPGGVIRAGFEYGHFRMAADYNIVASSTLVDIQNNPIGTTGNNYLNLSIGFYIGGGHWRK